MTDCPDCANAALQYRKGPLCAYHDLITGGGSSPTRQALAVTIDPKTFENAAQSFHYFTLTQPARGRKFGPWEERAVWAAYEAADRVSVLVGWDLG